MPTELALSGSQMWKLPANKSTTDAAKATGVPWTELTYEPQSVAAFYVNHSRKEAPRPLSRGDITLVAAIGGGTGDSVPNQLVSESKSHERWLRGCEVQARHREVGKGPQARSL